MLREDVVEAVRYQRGACENLGSPFYADLLGRALAEPDSSWPFWSVLDDWPGNPHLALAPLRLLGALHDLVLAGRAPALAMLYPTDTPSKAGEQSTVKPDSSLLWNTLNQVIEHERSYVVGRLDDEVQTNEVRRCAALLPGFLLLGRRFGLPLRLAEIGASAGLNLCWDHYHYQLGPHSWGAPNAPLALETEWSGEPPPVFDRAFEVASRRGCDISPLDVLDEDDCRRLRSFVWPDQFARRALLERALTVARALRPSLQRARAGDFVDEILADRKAGELTVLYHSIMWLYVPEAERQQITWSMREAGGRASERSPLAWLRMEFVDDKSAAISLDLWPGAEQLQLGQCHYHGTSVHWTPSASRTTRA